MRLPENFKIRIAGNFYRDTPNLVVCSDTPILRAERDSKTGELSVDFMVYDSSGRQKAQVRDSKLVKGSAEEYRVHQTDSSFEVRETATDRTICKLQRCRASRYMDLDASVLTHAPDGFFIHASPVQTNLDNTAKGENFRGLDAALVFEPRKPRRRRKK